jgi:hypothetical protein
MAPKVAVYKDLAGNVYKGLPQPGMRILLQHNIS